MKRSGIKPSKAQRIMPNERRRQLWRRHSLRLIERRGKWFSYQQFNGIDENDSQSD